MVTIFKTSVKNKTQVKKVIPLLDEIILPYGNWNFDLNDRDKILRVECNWIPVDQLISALKNEGFYCEEIAD